MIPSNRTTDIRSHYLECILAFRPQILSPQDTTVLSYQTSEWSKSVRIRLSDASDLHVIVVNILQQHQTHAVMVSQYILK